MNQSTQSKWPKIPVILSPAHQVAREKYMSLWLNKLDSGTYKYFDRQNHENVSKLPIRPGCRTLEIGAGIGTHLKYEDLKKQNYHCLELRTDFCEVLKTIIPAEQVQQGDIQSRQVWPDQYFDRVIAIHVLEHLHNLPKALVEIRRLLKPDGVLDIVLPCESGILHTVGRKFSAERLFVKEFQLDFAPIHKAEHVNTLPEILEELLFCGFEAEFKKFFPFPFRHFQLNFFVVFRLKNTSKIIEC